MGLTRLPYSHFVRKSLEKRPGQELVENLSQYMLNSCLVTLDLQNDMGLSLDDTYIKFISAITSLKLSQTRVLDADDVIFAK